MKYEYLKEVQNLLANYDFQEKYRKLIELEDKLSNLETDKITNYEQIVELIGSPRDYVEQILNDVNENNVTPLNNSNYAKAVSNETIEEVEQTMDMSGEFDTKERGNKALASVFKVIFAIITIIFFIFAFLVMAATIIVSIGVFFVIDAQTALSLTVGVLSGLIALGFGISFLKHLIYSIVLFDIRIVRLIISSILVVIFALVAENMLTSSFDSIGIYVTSNYYAIQGQMSNYNIDISNIDWNNLDIGQAISFGFEALTSFFK